GQQIHDTLGSDHGLDLSSRVFRSLGSLSVEHPLVALLIAQRPRKLLEALPHPLRLLPSKNRDTSMAGEHGNDLEVVDSRLPQLDGEDERLVGPRVGALVRLRRGEHEVTEAMEYVSSAVLLDALDHVR